MTRPSEDASHDPNEPESHANVSDELEATERAILARHLAVAARLRQGQIGGAMPYYARLCVRPHRGQAELRMPAQREVFLANHSWTGPDFALVHWRDAPLSRVFYGYFAGDSYEVDHEDRTLQGDVLARELVDFASGELVAVHFDKVSIVLKNGQWCRMQRSATALPQRPLAVRRQLVASIEAQLDEHQRAIVQAPADRHLLLLGEAGFGKTTVALARLAALSRACALSTFQALVVVPNNGLKTLCVHLLQRMRVTRVEVATFEAWVIAQARVVFPNLPRRRSAEPPAAVARIKRHPGLLSLLPEILRGTPAMRHLQAHEDRPQTLREQLYHLFGDREVMAPLQSAPLFPIRARDIEEVALHTRRQFSLTTEALHADVDAERLRTVDGLRIDAQTPDQDAGSIDVEDLPVVFALHHLATQSDATPDGALSRYDHVVIDEAQEFAAIELALLGRTCKPGGSVTMAGDANQQVDDTAFFEAWPRHIEALNVGEVVAQTLHVSYRCPPEIEALARAVVNESEAAPAMVQDSALRWQGFANPCAWQASLVESLLAVKVSDPQATVAVIFRHEASARLFHQQIEDHLAARLCLAGDFDFRPGVKVTCVAEVKGLEFDYVVIPDVDRPTYPESPAARRALYVALTRARFCGWLLWSGTVSPLLRPLLAMPHLSDEPV